MTLIHANFSLDTIEIEYGVYELPKRVEIHYNWIIDECAFFLIDH